jgi:hypothetical protein
VTCIAACVEDDELAIGGDSCMESLPRGRLTLIANSKVWRNGTLLMGGAGSSRLIQQVQYRLQLPDAEPGESADHYMASKLAVTVTELAGCRSKAALKALISDKEAVDMSLLVIRDARIFALDLQGHVSERHGGFDAIGSGQDEALGALHATAGIGMSASERVRRALMAAADLAPTVRAPFSIITAPAAKFNRAGYETRPGMAKRV